MVSQYTKYFTSFNDIVADELEEPITLVYPESRLDCPNCYLDTFGAVNRSVAIYKAGGPEPFENGQPCPHCGGKGYEAVEQTEVIMGRNYIVQKQFIDKSGLMIPEGTFQFVCRSTYMPKLLRCKYIIPNTNIQDFVNQKYYLLGQPDLPFFKMNPVKYLNSYWGKNNG